MINQRVRAVFCAILVVATMGIAAMTSQAQVIVNDTFDSYANDAAFESVWAPTGNTGAPYVGLLVPRTVAPFPPPPFDGTGDNSVTPPVPPVVGQAIAFDDLNGVNSYTGSFSIAPSATKAVRLTADIFEYVQGNRRFSVGLRTTSPSAENLLELGNWNSATFDPTNPGLGGCGAPDNNLPTTGYGYRLQLFNVGGNLVCNPNWQYFPLSLDFDNPAVDHNGDGRLGNGDGIVTPFDVGPGWHTYSATIEQDKVTLTLDLFRDGTVDSSVEWPVIPTANPFNNLRMGGPSGVARNQFAMADNVKLELIDLMTDVDGDFNNDGLWNCADINALTAAIASSSTDLQYDMNGDGMVTFADVTAASVGWLAVGGANNPAATGGDPFLIGDATLDGTVDGQDFIAWNTNKFTSGSAWCNGNFNGDNVVDGQDFIEWNTRKFTSSDSLSAVPEPTSAVWLAGVLLVVTRRRGLHR